MFCGCGGLSLGFQSAGIEIVAAFENWHTAVLCYQSNFSQPVFESDLSDVDKATQAIKKFSPEIIIGGPPCQDFSIAGNRKEGQRANLTMAFAQIVSKVRPRYFVMENVERATLSKAYIQAKSLLKSNGYGITERVLNACYFGVPQNRKRLFCVGTMGGPDNEMDSLLIANQTILPMTVREYFTKNNLPILFEHYYRHPRTYSKRAIFSIDEPAPTIRGVNRPRPAKYKKHVKDCAEPSNVRALTADERAIIQTFPVGFNWPDNTVSTEQMIGNAVPVKLAEHVACCLLNYAQGKVSETDLRFIDWLIQEKRYSSRAASDVLSRIKRANKIVTIENHSLSETLDSLVKSSDFLRINKTVQSQIKRAIRLFHEYRNRERSKSYESKV